MTAKLSVLRACRRVLRPGGRTAFYVIELGDGLSASERRQALDAGPTQVATPRPYPDLLATAGFSDIVVVDATAAYAATIRDWIRATRPHVGELARLEGREVVDERLAGWERDERAVGAGWLRRCLYAARRPPRR